MRLIFATVMGCAAGLVASSATSSGTSIAGAEIGFAVLMFGVSYLAGQLLKDKDQDLLKRDQPTTLATRGSFTAWWVGSRDVAPVFCAVGQRELRTEDAPCTGKGNLLTPQTDVLYENGWHVLGPGPMHQLDHIIEDGKQIWKGPITPESHPSGSVLQVDSGQAFAIYWGEYDQPVDPLLSTTLVGIASRWPGLAHIVWQKKRMNAGPRWPLLEYGCQREPSATATALLPGVTPWYPETATLDGPVLPVNGAVASASQDVGYLEVVNNRRRLFPPGREIELAGTGLADGTYEVLRTERAFVITATTPGGYPVEEVRTRIFLVGGTAGATGAGTVQAYTFEDDADANAAAMLAEALFAPAPLGMGFDPVNDFETWDLTELIALGVEADTQGWRSSVFAQQGELADGVIGTILQDHSCGLKLDSSTGDLAFVRIREPVGVLPNITPDMYEEGPPEIESNQGEKPANKLIFEFPNRKRRFTPDTIEIDEDGEAQFAAHKNARKVDITSSSHFPTVSELAEFRAAEELSNGGEYRLRANRQARLLQPGDAITGDEFLEVLMVTGVKLDPLSEVAELSIIPHVLAQERSGYVHTEGGGDIAVQDPEPDFRFAWLEVPERLAQGQQSVLTMRIRAHALMLTASSHLSRDNVTYTLTANGTAVAAGGFTTQALGVNSEALLVNGPEFTAEGPDITNVLDLSADPTNFRAGRQLAVFVTPDRETEICFLEKVTAIGGSTWRLDGLLRARYCSRRLQLPAGALVFIFTDTTFQAYQSALIEPDVDLYLKSQPASGSGSVELSSIPAYGERLYGKGLRPIELEAAYAAAPFMGSPAYRAGDDVTVRWSYSTAQTLTTGAGYQVSGAAVPPDVPDGAFEAQVLTPADALVASFAVTSPEVTIPTATLAAAPISNGDFKVRIIQTAGNGYATPALDLSISAL